MLDTKVVKIDSKIVILRCESKSVSHSVIQTFLQGTISLDVSKTYGLVVSEFVGLRVSNLGHELLVMHGRGVDLDLQRLDGGLLGNNDSLSRRCHLRSRG